MWDTDFRILTAPVAIICVFSSVFTVCIVCGFPAKRRKGKKRLIAAAVALLVGMGINALAFFCMHRLLLPGQKPADTLLSLVRASCTYQTLTFAGMIAAVCLLTSLAAGFLLRFAFYKRRRFRLNWLSKATLILAVLCLLIAAAASRADAYGVKRVVIQEVCRETLTPMGDTTIYSIKNRGSLPCEFNRLYLSDNPDKPRACAFWNVTIPANDVYRIEMEDGKPLHVDASGKTTLCLSTVHNIMLDSVTVPALKAEEVWRRNADGTGWETARIKPEPVYVPAPVFSVQSGFYDEAFPLEISAAEGLAVYYTLDGSRPSPTSPSALPYTEAIRVYDRSAEENRWRAIPNVTEQWQETWKEPAPVKKAFVVRAAAVDAEGNLSQIITQTYLVGLDQYKNATVLSLTADPEDLFSPETGIYVTGQAYDAWYQQYLDGTLPEDAEAPMPNYRKDGINWERPANLEIFEASEPLLNQSVGIRIQGAVSRKTALKRFSIYSRKYYSGSKWLRARLFDGKRVHSAVLRNGLLNAFTQTLTSDRDVAYQRSVPVSVFLNGEFWYNTYLMEKYSDSYFQETFGVDDDNVEYLKIGYLGKISPPEQVSYRRDILEYGESHDLTDPEQYEAYCQIVDIQSFIDCMAINIYLENMDTAADKNVLVWRTKEKENEIFGDGRWRWGLYDMDLMYWDAVKEEGHTRIEEHNSFALPGAYVSYPLNEHPIFQALHNNPDFCRRFVVTFMDLINTDFRPETVLAKLDAWQINSEELHSFFLNRAAWITQYMEEEFGLTGSQQPVTLRVADPQAGSVRLNTVTPDLSEGEWLGQYYTDYPITVSAQAREGYVFDYWTVNGEILRQPEAELPVPAGGLTIEAVFSSK